MNSPDSAMSVCEWRLGARLMATSGGFGGWHCPRHGGYVGFARFSGAGDQDGVHGVKKPVAELMLTLLFADIIFFA